MKRNLLLIPRTKDQVITPRTAVRSLCHLPAENRIRFLRKNGYPRFLCRFYCIDPGRQNFLEDPLINSRLYLSSPRSFNDPFDMRPRAVADGRLADVISKIERMPSPSRMAKRDAKLRAKDIWRSEGPTGILNEYNLEDILDNTYKETGVCCFTAWGGSMKSNSDVTSQGPRNLLMWAHYGCHHRGVCVIFDLSKDPVVVERLIRVKYANEENKVNWLSPRMDEECLNAAAVKGADWAYENEWRYIKLSSAGAFIEFNQLFVAGIILGANTSEEGKLKVGRLLEERKKQGMKILSLQQAFLDTKAKRLRFREAY